MRDECGRKVHEREIVAGFHLPANQEGAKAIVPTVRPFHHPAPWLSVHASDERRLPLLANMREDAPSAHGPVAVAKRVAFIEAAVLRAADAAAGPQNHGIEGSRQRPFVVQVRAA